MKDLIEKLAQAEGPSRELDCLVAAEADWALEGLTLTPKQAISALGLDWLTESADNYQSIFREIPRYTASIDAALTLVPEGWAIERLSTWPGGLSGCRLLGTHEHKGERWHNHKDGEATAEHAHLSIALCIAALSAKEPSQ